MILLDSWDPPGCRIYGFVDATSARQHASCSIRDYGLGADSTGALVSSEPVIIDVEREDIPTSLRVDPPSVTMGLVGDTLPLTMRAIDVDVTLEGSKFLNLFAI